MLVGGALREPGHYARQHGYRLQLSSFKPAVQILVT
jgi:hypothetical protein